MMSGGIGIPAGPAMVLALGLLLCSCSVKEDRRACPCYVRMEVGEFLHAGLPEALVSFSSGGGIRRSEVDLSEFRESGLVQSLPRGAAGAALAAGLKPIVCIGELLEEREGGRTEEVLARQLEGGLAGLTGEEMSRVVIAYEPVWAIGTGKTATPEMAELTHNFIRCTLNDMFGSEIGEGVRIQYGGSMKPENAKELVAQRNIDGGLIGGAALKAESFAALVHNAIAK